MKLLSKYVNIPKLVRTVWFLLWAILLGLSVIKLLFNQWYPIIVEDTWFIKMCNFIDSNVVLKYGIALLFYLLSVNIIFLTSIKRMWYKRPLDLIIINIIIIFCYFIKTVNNSVGMLIELAYLIVIPTIITIKTKPYRYKWLNIFMPIIIYFTLNIWQMNILFIKNIQEILTTAPTLVCLIIQFDYYIFLIITWIGVNYFMGIWSAGWFFGKSETELLAIKKEELAKEKPDMKLVEEIDKELEKRQAK